MRRPGAFWSLEPGLPMEPGALFLFRAILLYIVMAPHGPGPDWSPNDLRGPQVKATAPGGLASGGRSKHNFICILDTIDPTENPLHIYLVVVTLILMPRRHTRGGGRSVRRRITRNGIKGIKRKIKAVYRKRSLARHPNRAVPIKMEGSFLKLVGHPVHTAGNVSQQTLLAIHGFDRASFNRTLQDMPASVDDKPTNKLRINKYMQSVTVVSNQSLDCYATIYKCHARRNLNFQNLYGINTETVPAGGIFYDSGSATDSAIVPRGFYNNNNGDTPVTGITTQQLSNPHQTLFNSHDFCRAFKIDKVTNRKMSPNKEYKFKMGFVGPKVFDVVDNFDQTTGASSGRIAMFKGTSIIIIVLRGQLVGGASREGYAICPAVVQYTESIWYTPILDIGAARRNQVHTGTYDLLVGDDIVLPKAGDNAAQLAGINVVV